MANSTQRRIRSHSHAGSWYSASSKTLASQLQGFLDNVTTPISCIGPESNGQSLSELPVPGGRVIIAPHAGYSYSGPAAAYAYKSWDISKANRVFLLGPSHHYYLSKAALTQCDVYATPLGDINVDLHTTAELYSSGLFEWLSQSVDEAEHSLEMHLPYIYTMFTREFGTNTADHPQLIPIMIGNTSAETERRLARLLAPYLSDATTAWVVSSDFAHWGTRFGYTYYKPNVGAPHSLGSRSSRPTKPYIHESIRIVDFECIEACESGSYDGWLRCLQINGNTVCGRHPIGVMLGTMEEARKNNPVNNGIGNFRFVRYERSEEVSRPSDSSVSYASAIAII